MTAMQMMVVLGGLLALGARLSASSAPLSASPNSPSLYRQSNNRIPDVWEVLARHGALEPDHQLARKSVRSPSRRLRFGRRSDPLMPPEPPMMDSEELENLEEELLNRQSRTPVRMRFGRRSLETAVPHIFPVLDRDEEDSSQRKEIRAPSRRLRFGRRSDIFMAPYEQAEREFKAAEDGAVDPEE